MNLLVNANAKRIPIADKSVNCVVTSPPYYGQRDYNVANQIGLEQSPDDYVDAMVQVFREIHRVLRDDGVVWLNLGDSYAGSGNGSNDYRDEGASISKNDNKYQNQKPLSDLPAKNLIGIPWRVAFALQADGWWLRQDIIWHKPNPMPESVKDRCTKAHEYIFLLTKSARYWYDNTAIFEPANYDGRNDTVFKGSLKYDDDTLARVGGERWPNSIVTGKRGEEHSGYVNPDGSLRVQEKDGIPARNKRSVWTVTTKPYPGSHYAVFPPDLIEPCILAGCPETVCAECGAPYERVVERVSSGKRYATGKSENKNDAGLVTAFSGYDNGESAPKFKTLGWQPTCDCDAGTKAGVVLDPFAGSGTTLMVARKHRRNAIGLDLNYEYLTKNARERLQYGCYVPVADNVNQLTIGGLI